MLCSLSSLLWHSRSLTFDSVINSILQFQNLSQNFILQRFILLIFITNLTEFAACRAVDSHFPAGMQAGETVIVKLGGAGNEQVEQLLSDIQGLQVEKAGPGSFRLTVAKGTKP